jgi:predicted transcriptional regulator
MITLLTWTGTFCWVVCFVWMHHISKRQDALLAELRGIAKGIEATTRAGHELIKEVHPAVGQIKESIEDVASVMKEK